MSIVCGTDFSAQAAEAATLAARLARRLEQPLLLVHVLDTRGVLFNQATVLDALQRKASQALDAEVARLSAFGVPVQARVSEGWPDEGLLEAAEGCDAGLVVLSATGAGGAPHSLFGSTAERIAGRTRLPLLVVRDAAPLLRWLDAGPPLRLLCAVDGSHASEAAIDWLRRLLRMGPAEPLVAGFSDEPHALRHLEDRLHRQLGPQSLRVIAGPARSGVAQSIAELAEREGAELLVVGSHQRHGLDRLLHGSVSLELLRQAKASVLVAPASLADRLPPPAAPQSQRVLVATDLSAHGDRAARFALSMLPPGSRVRLMTVTDPRRMPDAPLAWSAADPAQQARYEAWRAQCRRALDALVPADLQAHGLSVETVVVDGDDPAEAILRTAAEIDADLVCLGTAGRTGLAASLLGSVAQAVLGRGRRPVMLVPAKDG